MSGNSTLLAASNLPGTNSHIHPSIVRALKSPEQIAVFEHTTRDVMNRGPRIHRQNTGRIGGGPQAIPSMEAAFLGFKDQGLASEPNKKENLLQESPIERMPNLSSFWIASA